MIVKAVQNDVFIELTVLDCELCHMGNETAQEKQSDNANVTGTIIITSPTENVIAMGDNNSAV